MIEKLNQKTCVTKLVKNVLEINHKYTPLFKNDFLNPSNNKMNMLTIDTLETSLLCLKRILICNNVLRETLKSIITYAATLDSRLIELLTSIFRKVNDNEDVDNLEIDEILSKAMQIIYRDREEDAIIIPAKEDEIATLVKVLDETLNEMEADREDYIEHFVAYLVNNYQLLGAGIITMLIYQLEWVINKRIF
jgi:hypothetical protein